MTDIHAKFGNYTLRSVGQNGDHALLEDWIDQDQYHRISMNPEFFLAQRQVGSIWVPDPRPNCYAIEDDKGVVMFVRLSRAARVHIQFMPMTGVLPRTRSAAGLLHGMRFLQVGLARAGAEEWIFSTENSSLQALAKMRLGFTASPHEWVKEISPFSPALEQEEASLGKEGGK